MDKKQQFIEKCLKKILTSKFIIALALELPAEVYDDFIKEIAKVIHFQLSECWDMAGEEKLIPCCPSCGSTTVEYPPMQSGGRCGRCNNPQPFSGLKLISEREDDRKWFTVFRIKNGIKQIHYSERELSEGERKNLPDYVWVDVYYLDNIWSFKSWLKQYDKQALYRQINSLTSQKEGKTG